MSKQGWVFSPIVSVLVVGGVLMTPVSQPLKVVPSPTQTIERSPEVTAFVRQHYLHGLPYARARSFGPAAVPTLLEMLRDPNEDDFVANTVLILGLVGGPDVGPALVDVLERRYIAEVSFWQYMGLLTVNVALGDLANGGDDAALNYLRDGADPDFWRERIAWSYEGVGREELQELLAKMAIYGLALSGRESALDRLRELLGGGRETLLQNLTEAVDLHGRIVREGIDAVFAAQGR